MRRTCSRASWSLGGRARRWSALLLEAMPGVVLWAMLWAMLWMPGARAQEPSGERARAARATTEGAAPDSPGVRAILELVVNEQPRGEVSVVLRDGDVWMKPEDLVAARVRSVRGVEATVLGVAHVSLASLAPAIRHRFSEHELRLYLDVEPEALASSVVAFRSARPQGIDAPATLSGFLNYAVRLEDLGHPSAFTELGVAFGELLAFTGASASIDGGLVRGLSYVQADERDALRRWTLGDAFVHGGELGGALLVGGLTVQRRFELDPYFIRQRTFVHRGATSTPSTLDVYVNGERVRSEALPPGPFELQGLRVPHGSGEVRYVLRDAFGREQAVEIPVYGSTSMLAEGLHDFTYSLGARRLGVGESSWGYERLGALGHHRYGFSDGWNVGGRLELALDLASAGADVSWLTPFGQLDVVAAASVTPVGLGFAGMARFGHLGRLLGAALSLRAVSDAYATLSLLPTDERDLLEARGYLSLPLGAAVSLGASTWAALARDAGGNAGADLSVQWHVASGLSLIGQGRVGLDAVGLRTEVGLRLSYALDDGVHTALGARLEDASPSAFAELSRSLPRGEGVGFRAGAVLGELPHAHAQGQLQGPHGRYQVSVDAGRDKRRLTLEAAGGIVGVYPGGLFLTRPVQQGFALVRVPDVEDVRVFLNNHEVGRTDAHGNLLIPELLPYYANRVRIADTDLPLEYAIASEEQLVAPPARGGVLASFSARLARYYRGQVLLRTSAGDVVPAFGELTVDVDGTPLASPLTRDGRFELELDAPGLYPARIEHEGGSCELSVRVPVATTAVTDIGTWSCTP